VFRGSRTTIQKARRRPRIILAGDDLQLPPIVQGVYPDLEAGEPVLHRSTFEAVRSRVPTGSPMVKMTANVVMALRTELLDADGPLADLSSAGRDDYGWSV
jgi:hypothetical protein